MLNNLSVFRRIKNKEDIEGIISKDEESKSGVIAYLEDKSKKISSIPRKIGRVSVTTASTTIAMLGIPLFSMGTYETVNYGGDILSNTAYALEVFIEYYPGFTDFLIISGTLGGLSLGILNELRLRSKKEKYQEMLDYAHQVEN